MERRLNLPNIGAPKEKPHPLVDAINKVSQIKGVTVGKGNFKVEVGQYDTKVSSGWDRRSWSPTFETQKTFGINLTKEL